MSKTGVLLSIPGIDDTGEESVCTHCRAITQAPYVMKQTTYCSEHCYDQSTSLMTAYDKLDTAYSGTMEVLIAALDARECETHCHSERVAEYTHFLAKKMGLQGEDLQNIYRGGLLHDIGKIGIPDAILLKTFSLTQSEWVVMKRHPELGRRILSSIEFLRPATEIVFAHEERYDGSGYPRGLRGKEIPFGARIFSVMDALDAMAFERPYHKAIPFNAVVREIKRGAKNLFDPNVVEVFHENVNVFENWIEQDKTNPCETHWQHANYENMKVSP